MPGTLTATQGSPGGCGDGSKRPAEAGTGLLPATSSLRGLDAEEVGTGGGRRTRPTLSQATGHRPQAMSHLGGHTTEEIRCPEPAFLG